jgi:hypothetical protein
MTDPKLDLTALDPSRDQVRWDRLVRSVAARGAEAAARRRPGWLALQLSAWVRPALACAAGAALLAWVPTWLRPAPAESTASAPARTEALADRAALLAAWAASDEPAAASTLLLVLGDHDDAR